MDVFLYNTSTRALTRISLTPDGQQGNGASDYPAISGNGRYVAFGSGASNLVAGDSNAKSDCFLYDRQSATITRVSVSSSGAQSDGDSGEYSPAISSDGRYVAFVSNAANLVDGDSNGVNDIFIRDTVLGTTSRVSVASDGSQSNGGSNAVDISADGRYLVFQSSATNLGTILNGTTNIFLHDRQTGQTTVVSKTAAGAAANSNSSGPRISADGNAITFSSFATNFGFVDTNSNSDVFLYRRATDQLALLSHSHSGAIGSGASTSPAISRDGTYVIFSSSSDNFDPSDLDTDYDCYVYDGSRDVLTRLSVKNDGTSMGGQCAYPDINGDGHYVTFASTAYLTQPDRNGVGAGLPTHIYLAENDICPNDSSKSTPGVCGCGTADTDSDQDGTADCNDRCPSDPAKAAAGQCGCGAVDTDTDQDGTADCNDGCPADPAKTATGGCGCGVTDSDGDQDGTLDCNDGCSSDNGKTAPGICGCGTADIDSDGDGTANCNDACPEDLNKTAAGVCGCGITDSDANGNGNADCLDPAGATVPAKPSLKRSGSRVTVTMQAFPGASVRYVLIGEMKQGRRTTRTTKNATTASVKLTGLRKGTWSFSYTVRAGSTASKRSGAAKIKIP